MYKILCIASIEEKKKKKGQGTLIEGWNTHISLFEKILSDEWLMLAP